MQLPAALLESLTGLPGFNADLFSAAHNRPETIISVRLNPRKTISSVAGQPVSGLKRVPWAGTGFYLDTRPSFTFDPFFHAGCYYVQEASSMLLEQALEQLLDLDQPLRVLDLSAAPGGKSTHIQSLISDESLLVSNDVIRSRAMVLRENIIKWGCENVAVTNSDPKDFFHLGAYFDCIVVDAPCSGSGLFRKDPESVKEWSLHHVQLCSQRQQRILADILPALKKGGVLIYSTCSYSKEEDEDITRWLRDEFSLDYVPLVIDPAWGITDTGMGYRCWPGKTRGEGFYISCFRKRTGEELRPVKLKRKPVYAGTGEVGIIGRWMNTEGFRLIKHENTVYAWPRMLADDFLVFRDTARLLYSGVLAGELVRDKFLPDHALALSRRVSENVPRAALHYEEAIKYLQRKDPGISVNSRGWHLAAYEDQPLGWLNVLSNRINNYYPKESRILKEN